MSSRTQSPTKRLIQELQSYKEESQESLLQLGPVSDDDLMHWTGVMKGVPGTAYEGGLWELDVRIPDDYPKAPPKVRFITPICHPNVNFKTGEICLDLLGSGWTAVFTIASTLTSIRVLLTSAEPDSPLNLDISNLFRQGDNIGAEALIRYYTETHKWEGR